MDFKLQLVLHQPLSTMFCYTIVGKRNSSIFENELPNILLILHRFIHTFIHCIHKMYAAINSMIFFFTIDH